MNTGLYRSCGEALAIAANGEPVVTFHNDGRITLGEGLKPDEAAREFLRILIEMYPQWIRECAERAVNLAFEEAIK